ncbi:MAG: helix-turn-helix domain-containing protein [Nocardioidaceae bacterium]|nr:helix-turn-helix domain-containing protein [Nocardioidaceae bacterium]
MDTQLAALSRSIDPALLGQRIRNARIAAGMTQSQVAGEDVSTAYISRIEDGQRRPEAGLLERMAGRMSTTLEELLLGVTKNQEAELHVELDFAELAIRAGNAKTALAKVAGVQNATSETILPQVHRRASYVRALGLEAAGDLDEAILLLESLIDEQTADARTLRVLVSLTRCHRDAGDQIRAIEVGERAQALVDEHKLGGLGEAIELAAILAGAHAARGDVDDALRVCRAAIESSDALGSGTGKVDAYARAAERLSAQGSHEAALPLAEKALRLAELGDEARHLGRLRTELGTLLLQGDDPDLDSAIAALEKAEGELAWATADAVDRGQNLLAQARSRFLRRDFDAAATLATASRTAAGDAAPIVAAESHVLEGQIAAEQGRKADARTAYREAIRLAGDVEAADRDAAQFWFELGGLLDEIGERDDASDAYRRAAASTGLVAPRNHQRKAEAAR